jgi:glucan endo-1,6-beta-glucosidase
VLGIRAIELALGIICDDTLASGILTDSIALPALTAAIPIIARLSFEYGIGPLDSFNVNALLGSSGTISVGHLLRFCGRHGRQRHCLSTQYVHAY